MKTEYQAEDLRPLEPGRAYQQSRTVHFPALTYYTDPPATIVQRKMSLPFIQMPLHNCFHLLLPFFQLKAKCA